MSARHPRILGILLPLIPLLAAATAPSPCRANGVNTHVWISLHAISHLPEGRLKQLVTRADLQEALVNGSMFPDGGYAIKNGYGETAHWEPFVMAYLAWIRDEYVGPFEDDGEAARQVVFLLGIASHGMADSVFDSQFVEAALRYDKDGWSDGLLDGVDSITDVELVAQTGQRIQVEPYVPPGVDTIFGDRLKQPVSRGVVENGQFLMTNVVMAYGKDTSRDPAKVAQFRKQYPWTTAHLLDKATPGSPPCEGEVVARYWQAIWDRLHGEQRGENLIIATYPPDGGKAHPTSRDMVESQLVVVFGAGIVPASLPADAVVVTDSKGTRHPVTLDFFRGPDGHLVRIFPVADWPADDDLTVLLPAGIAMLDGFKAGGTSTFSFSTKPGVGPDPDATGDPTPRLGEPARPPAVAPADLGVVGGGGSGGCDMGGGGSGRSLLFGALGLALIAARRRARAPR